jgi:hypothetical protein|tara:strand:+ start:369 stop:2153 length:1785 start_codon:yes stop_codon:yes gene_type:complete
MIKLTEFTSVVDTYKKNFAIRKERFKLLKRKGQEESREKREKKIETSKFLGNAGKFLPSSLKKTTSDLFDTALNFGFALFVGSLLENLSSIFNRLRNIYKKIEDIVKGTKEFVSGILGGLQSFYDGAVENIDKLNQLVSDIKTEAEKYGEIEILGVKLKEIVDAIATIAGVLGSAQFFKDVLGFLKPKPTRNMGGAASSKLAKKPPFVKTPKGSPILTPKEVKTSKKINKVAAVLTRQPVMSGGGAGASSGGSVKPSLSQRILSFIKGEDIPIRKKSVTLNMPSILELAEKQLNFFNKFNPRESELASLMNDIIRKSEIDILSFADQAQLNAIKSFAQKKGFTSIVEELEGIKTIEQMRDVVKVPKPGLAKKVAQSILNKLNGIAKFLKWAALGLLIAELSIDFQKGDYNAMAVKLAAFGFSGLAVLLTNALGIKIAAVSGGVGLPAALLIGAGSMGVGIAVDTAIRNYFLGDKKSEKDKLPVVKGTESLIPVDEKELDKRYGIDRSYRDTTLEPDINLKPGMLSPGDYTSEELRELKKIQRLYQPQSSVSKPEIIGKSLNSYGLDGKTSYGQGGFVPIYTNLIAIQPIEVPAA